MRIPSCAPGSALSTLNGGGTNIPASNSSSNIITSQRLHSNARWMCHSPSHPLSFRVIRGSTSETACLHPWHLISRFWLTMRTTLVQFNRSSHFPTLNWPRRVYLEAVSLVTIEHRLRSADGLMGYRVLQFSRTGWRRCNPSDPSWSRCPEARTLFCNMLRRRERRSY